MLKVNRIDNQFIVSFFNTKRFNSTLTSEVKEQLTNFLNTSNTEVTLNFEGINFVDSAAFSTLIELMEIAESNNSVLSIYNVSEDVRELISLMKLEQTLKVLNH